MQTQEATIQVEVSSFPNNSAYYHKGIAIENIVELKKKGLSNDQVAKILGCSKTNVTQRLRDCKDELEGLERYKNHRADILAWKGRRVLNAITEDDLKSASLLQKTTAYGILYDKERLELGKSTENISARTLIQHISNDADDIRRRKDDLLRELDCTID